LSLSFHAHWDEPSRSQRLYFAKHTDCGAVPQGVTMSWSLHSSPLQPVRLHSPGAVAWHATRSQLQKPAPAETHRPVNEARPSGQVAWSGGGPHLSSHSPPRTLDASSLLHAVVAVMTSATTRRESRPKVSMNALPPGAPSSEDRSPPEKPRIARVDPRRGGDFRPGPW
jgi:hypothetical protein